MLLGNLILGKIPGATTFPIVLGAISIIASIIGTLFVGIGKVDRAKIMNSLYVGLGIAGIISAGVFYWITTKEFGLAGIFVDGHNESAVAIWACAVIGLLITGLITWITEYYTGTQFSPVKRIANASITGHATNIISGLAVSMQATALPGLVIVVGILCSYALSGLYGVGIAVMAMLSMAGIVVAIDSFGPITDNAGGIAEFSQAPAEVRHITDVLDGVGNTTKALTKGYAVGSAALAAFLLFSAYLDEVKKATNVEGFPVDLSKVQVFLGGFLGLMLIFFFSSLAIRAVGTAAGAIIEEVRRQFREHPGIMQGTERPNYALAVDITARAGLREMVVPGLLAVLFPIVVGLVLKAEAAAALLMVGTMGGILMATVLNNSGGTWDNAKKFIELGHLTGDSGTVLGKGTDAHAAAVVGDTVGDPFKDTAGPSLHVLIKLLSTITLVMAPLFIGR
jgi:K(+)-stimulated pyrophosphate-energized sodium pump